MSSLHSTALQVRSSRDPNVFYTTTEDSCTCQGFTLGHRICRHIRIARGEPVTSSTGPEVEGAWNQFDFPDARLYAALARFQAEVKPAVRNAKGQVGQNRNYTYAALNDIWDVIHKPLADNGLAVIQMVGPFEDGKQYLRTIIVHKDGGRIEEQGAIPCSQANAQGAGSAITYLRRYSLGAALGLITEEDDDGAAASANDQPQRDTAPRQNAPARAPERATAPVLSPSEPAPATSDGNAWKSLLKLMPEERVAKKDVEPIIGGWSPVHLDAWLDADSGNSVQFLILKAKGMVPA